jgi:ribosomal protein L7/L12
MLKRENLISCLVALQLQEMELLKIQAASVDKFDSNTTMNRVRDTIKAILGELNAVGSDFNLATLEELYTTTGKIQAVKYYRDCWGCGLITSRKTVEDIADRHGWKTPFERGEQYNETA